MTIKWSKTQLSILGGIITLIFLWQLLLNYVNHNRLQSGLTSLEIFLPSPLTIGQSFIAHRSVLLTELSYTLVRAMAGLILGTLIAILVELILIYFPKLRQIILPLALGINSFPIVGFAPLIILIFGQGSALGIIAVSTLVCYFPTLITLDHGIRQIDSGLIELFKIWRATKWQLFLKLQVPMATPALINALKLSVPASIIGATLGEWLGTKNGMGKLITLTFYQLKPGLLYAALISLMLISLLLTFFIDRFSRRWLKWQN